MKDNLVSAPQFEDDSVLIINREAPEPSEVSAQLMHLELLMVPTVSEELNFLGYLIAEIFV